MDQASLIRYLKARPKQGAGRGWRCPDESQIAAYVDGTVREPEKQRIEAHLASCDFCLDQVAFLVRIQKTELPSSVPLSLLARARDVVRERPRIALIPVWGRVAAAAAVVCLAVAVTVSVRRSHLTTPPSGLSPTVQSGARPALESPSQGAGEVRGAVEIAPLVVISPAPESVVARSDLQFQWKAASGALDYDVRLMTDEGDLVWEHKTEGTSLKVPSDVRIEAGRRYYYLLIRADLAEGKTVESKAVAFRVAAQN